MCATCSITWNKSYFDTELPEPWRTHSCVPRSHSPESSRRHGCTANANRNTRLRGNTLRQGGGKASFLPPKTFPPGIVPRSCERLGFGRRWIGVFKGVGACIGRSLVIRSLWKIQVVARASATTCYTRRLSHLLRVDRKSVV